MSANVAPVMPGNRVPLEPERFLNIKSNPHLLLPWQMKFGTAVIKLSVRSSAARGHIPYSTDPEAPRSMQDISDPVYLSKSDVDDMVDLAWLFWWQYRRWRAVRTAQNPAIGFIRSLRISAGDALRQWFRDMAGHRLSSDLPKGDAVVSHDALREALGVQVDHKLDPNHVGEISPVLTDGEFDELAPLYVPEEYVPICRLRFYGWSVTKIAGTLQEDRTTIHRRFRRVWDALWDSLGKEVEFSDK